MTISGRLAGESPKIILKVEKICIKSPLNFGEEFDILDITK